MDGIRALTFDTGGTILDWHSGIATALAEIGRLRGVEANWASITNEYRRRSLQTMLDAIGPRFNIDDVHGDMLRRVLREHGIEGFTADDFELVKRRWHVLEAWPDFAPAARRIRARHSVVSFTILSLALVIDVSRRNRLDWDCIISCEMLGVYKVRPEAYRVVTRLLQLEPREVLMVACHNFDLDAARKEGFRTALVRRPAEWGPSGPPDPVPNPDNDLIVDDFAQLADAVGA